MVRCHLSREVIAADTLLLPTPLRQLASHFNSYKRYGICFPVIVYVEVAVMDAYVLFPAMQVPVWYRPPGEGEFAESMGSWNNGHAVLQRERRSFVKVPAGGGGKQQPSLMAPPCRPPAHLGVYNLMLLKNLPIDVTELKTSVQQYITVPVAQLCFI